MHFLQLHMHLILDAVVQGHLYVDCELSKISGAFSIFQHHPNIFLLHFYCPDLCWPEWHIYGTSVLGTILGKILLYFR